MLQLFNISQFYFYLFEFNTFYTDYFIKDNILFLQHILFLHRKEYSFLASYIRF